METRTSSLLKFLQYVIIAQHCVRTGLNRAKGIVGNDMDKLLEFQCFLKIAGTGSFTAAGAALGVTSSAASKQIKSLEARLGARLFNRTTRSVSLTEAGRAFRERIEPLLTEVEDAELAVSQLSDEPRGVLRVNAPMDFGRTHLAPAIASFARSHDALEIEVEFADRFVGIVEEGFDVVVRIGSLSDSSLVARYLGPCRRVLCAAPQYLAERGTPQSIRDLAGHTRVAYSYESELSWTLDGPNGSNRVSVPIRHRSNNGELTRSLLLDGQGLALLPTFLVGDDLRSGRLKAVLPDYAAADLPIHAVYPHRRYLPAKVRHFVDHLLGACGPTPAWDRDI
jgi:DNA-binding transcriptional LysR family regulator